MQFHHMLHLLLCQYLPANAGVSLTGLTFNTLLNPVPLGILLVYFLKTNRCSIIFLYIN